MLTAEAMDRHIDAWPTHDHDVKALCRDPLRPPADQLLLHPAPVLPTEAGIMHMQQRDAGALLQRRCVDHPQGQLELLACAGGEILDGYQDAAEGGDALTPEVHHHDGAMGGAADPIDDVSEEPGPQLVRPSGSDQQQVRRLFEGGAAHAPGDVLVESQQGSGWNLQGTADRRCGSQSTTGRDDSAVEAAAHLLETGIDHGERQQ